MYMVCLQQYRKTSENALLFSQNDKIDMYVYTVSGSRFEISCECLEGEPFQRLPLMVTEAEKNGTPLVFDIDRPAEQFAAILAYYQTGEFTYGLGCVPGPFKENYCTGI